ncbi:sodium:proton antiporter [Sulfolobales archaeon HS-7]|nr:sodium:proton antiporter [Sulfolobales archaeon HS-7]
MNTLEISLLDLGVMLILAKLAEEALDRIGLVRFVGPIIVGIILGKGVLGLIPVNPIISFVTSLGIVFLLFLAGAEEIGGELRGSSTYLISSILQVIVPVAIVTLLLYSLGYFSLPLIIPLAMTSVGPLTRMLMDLNLTKDRRGIAVFYQATLAEILAVILFAIFLSKEDILLSIIEISILFIAIFLLGSKLSVILERIEGYVKVREIEFASLISFIFVIGAIAQLYNFNSAIAALFLGFLLRDYFADRPELKERLHGFTYGFFEPLFFVSIGLYFVKITTSILIIGGLVLLTIVIGKLLAGTLTSKLAGVEIPFNALATSTKGGVDASLLIAALTAGAITGYEYSLGALAITLAALIIPLLFRLKYGVGFQTESSVKLSQPISSIIRDKKPIFATCSENLRNVIEKLSEKGARAIAVVNENRKPIGMITVQQLIEIDPSLYTVLNPCNVDLQEVLIIDDDPKVIEVLRKFRETESPLIIIVDRDGTLVNTIYEREILREISKI